MSVTKQPRRTYTSGDAEMLTAISTITEAAIEYKTELQAERSNWVGTFFTTLKTDIDTVIQTHLGIDSAKSLRQSTNALKDVQEPAIEELVTFKKQLQRDFRTDKPTLTEYLKQLGFTTYFKAAYSKDQEALVQLLFAFQANMIGSTQADIVAKGAATARITRISGYAQTLKDANVTQETFKSSRKTVTADSINTFNDIYARVMDVAVIAANLFKKDKAKQSRFLFSKLVAAENTYKKTTPAPPPPKA